jgi:hypothetical protein
MLPSLESHGLRQLYPNGPNIGVSASREIKLLIYICIFVSGVSDFC